MISFSLSLKNPATRLDQAGIVASLLCAVHCAFMPLLVSLLPLWGLSRLADEGTEWLLLGAALCIGLCNLLPGFWRHHRHWQPMSVFVAGAALMLFVRLGLEEESPLELFGVVMGGDRARAQLVLLPPVLRALKF